MENELIRTRSNNGRALIKKLMNFQGIFFLQNTIIDKFDRFDLSSDALSSYANYW